MPETVSKLFKKSLESTYAISLGETPNRWQTELCVVPFQALSSAHTGHCPTLRDAAVRPAEEDGVDGSCSIGVTMRHTAVVYHC